MENQFSRTELMLGKNAIDKLKASRVAVFGVGGVGGYVVEALARAGVGNFDLIDNDVVSISNINRQIIATLDTMGLPKVEVMKNRILSINKDANINVYQCFYLPSNEHLFDFSKYDYVVDAVDTVTAKISIIMKAKENNVKVISSMGTGNKLDPTKFEISDIYKTSVCPLAKVMRHELKKRGIKSLKVLYSKELPVELSETLTADNGKVVPGSVSFVPSVAGLIIAGEVIKDLIK